MFLLNWRKSLFAILGSLILDLRFQILRNIYQTFKLIFCINCYKCTKLTINCSVFLICTHLRWLLSHLMLDYLKEFLRNIRGWNFGSEEHLPLFFGMFEASVNVSLLWFPFSFELVFIWIFSLYPLRKYILSVSLDQWLLRYSTFQFHLYSFGDCLNIDVNIFVKFLLGAWL
jgi:hypothetical protein